TSYHDRGRGRALRSPPCNPDFSSPPPPTRRLRRKRAARPCSARGRRMTAVVQEAVRPFRLEWGWMLLRGLLAIALGVFAFSNPPLTIGALTAAWGGYVFVDGVLALVFARRATHLDLPGWPSVLIGILGIGSGVLTFLVPRATTISLVVISALWGLSV